MIKLLDLSYQSRGLGPLSISLDGGQLIMLCGPSGSGKSTLCQLLLGELEPSQGLIRWQENARTGFLGGDVESQLLGSSVAQELDFAQRFSPTRSSDSWESLKTGILERFRGRLAVDPHELSRGEQQILLLASMVLGPYTCLVLDEGLSGLDQSAFDEFCQALRGIARAGGLVLIVSHEPRLLRWSDRVLGLREGKLCFDLSPSDITWHQFEQVRLWAGVFIPGSAQSIVWEKPLKHSRGQGLLSSSPAGRAWLLPGPLDFTLHFGEALALAGVSGSGKSYWLHQLLHSNELVPAYRVMLTDNCSTMLWRRTVFLEIEASLAVGKRRGFTPHYLDFPKDWLDRSPRALSVGQRKLVVCYCLLLQCPDILLMEEPFGGLDRGLRVLLERWLHQYLETGGALVYSSHNPDELWLYPNRLIVFDDGAPLWIGDSWDEFCTCYPQESRLGTPGFTTGPDHEAAIPDN